MAERQRVSLGTRDAGSASGLALLQRLESVWSDGLITHEEVTSLAEWMDAEALNPAAPPGLHFLREELAGILADGIVTEPEKRLLRNAILRVLPTAERERARARFAEAAERSRETRRQEREREQQLEATRPTEAQLEYIRALGGTYPDGVTKAQASSLIDELLTTMPTVRQRMLLRFWNRQDLGTAGVEAVSSWLDEWYLEDPDRRAAWALWKREAGDLGERAATVIDRVPLGAGPTFLARVKAARAVEGDTPATGAASTGSTSRVWLWVAVIIGAGALIAWLTSSH